MTQILNVLSAYTMNADNHDPDTLESGGTSVGAFQFGFHPFLATKAISLAHW